MIYNPDYTEDLWNCIKDIQLLKNDLKKNEEEITTKIITHLKEKHKLKVVKGVPEGFLRFAPDIVYDEGKVGVEIKLAKQLFDNNNGSKEIQRLFGQTYYYCNRKDSPYKYFYAGYGLLVLIIGELKYEDDEKMKEIKRTVDKIGASFAYVVIK